MSENWKPGDVAVVSCDDHDCTKPDHPAMYSSVDKWWVMDDGTYSSRVTPIRRLLVIDPEDREQVERLMDTVTWLFSSADVDAVQAALREFANPTPPKPEEPTGLGAVVEDAEGSVWVRFTERAALPWRQARVADTNLAAATTCWRHIDAVRVLSPGVTP